MPIAAVAEEELPEPLPGRGEEELEPSGRRSPSVMSSRMSSIISELPVPLEPSMVSELPERSELPELLG